MTEGATVVIVFLVAIGSTIFVVAGIMWMLNSSVNDLIEIRAWKSFSKDLRDVVKCSQPNWEDIKRIAETRDLTHNQAYRLISKCHREILAGRENELKEHIGLIKGYIDEYLKDEPFEGVPDELRVHLERLRDNAPDQQNLLQPLTSHIKELLHVNNRENKKLRFYTAGGFFVGLIGLIVGISPSFSQPNIVNKSDEPLADSCCATNSVPQAQNGS